jgi:hypothetical protein
MYVSLKNIWYQSHILCINSNNLDTWWHKCFHIALKFLQPNIRPKNQYLSLVFGNTKWDITLLKIAENCHLLVIYILWFLEMKHNTKIRDLTWGFRQPLISNIFFGGEKPPRFVTSFVSHGNLWSHWRVNSWYVVGDLKKCTKVI